MQIHAIHSAIGKALKENKTNPTRSIYICLYDELVKYDIQLNEKVLDLVCKLEPKFLSFKK